MRTPTLNDQVTQQAAAAALREYKASRGKHDALDYQIERIYRNIAKGKTVISVRAAIAAAGVDAEGQPKLAFGRADFAGVRYNSWTRGSGRLAYVDFLEHGGNSRWHCEIELPGSRYTGRRAITPRIPPQYRPPLKSLNKYFLLWEADWHADPIDPFLLQQIAADAFIVLAAWDLTPVEMAVIRTPR